MKALLNTFSALVFSAVSMQAAAATQTITCGDHWFKVQAVVGLSAAAEVTVTGDSIGANEFIAKADTELYITGLEQVWKLTFKEERALRQLFVQFVGDERDGLGTYVSGQETTHFNCSR